ncbi:hypothetical protein C5F59_037075 [Streptomyces sp. QL37]|uniref:hypothetical protein n=1 Tax=Streptomyces sp. QL37 TaxID=2093747 RepID=UPI000CF22B82|nr:hypothetical protein [Streptomyces sp. QL37]PPQ61752.1 hypothetical protein C5F59_37590 [Streptomyces sp. QL37]
MTNRTEHTTDPLSPMEPPPVDTPGTTPGRAPGSARGAAPGTAAGFAPGESMDREPRRGGPDDLSVPPAPRKAPAVQAERTGHHGAAGSDRLVPPDDQDRLALRMQQAVTDFVESPRRAVEEADSTFDQIVSGLTEALAERRRVLRASWQEQDTEAQTEELRIALQRYRDLSEQLLKI